MATTTVSFRITPPLYGLNGAELEAVHVAGLELAKVRVTLVDSGTPTVMKARADAGGSVTLPGDNLGVLHNTRLDVELPGPLDEWMAQLHESSVLSVIANRVIDWYRLTTQLPAVRRISETPIRGFAARDEHREGWAGLGFTPGIPSSTAGIGDPELIADISRRLALGTPLPLWVALRLDAEAELREGELRVTVLLANASMETAINYGFRRLATQDEITASFTDDEPTSFRRLLKRLNALTNAGFSNTQLVNLANRVNHYRNDVSHGNPVALDGAIVRDSIDALKTLSEMIERAVHVELDARAGWTNRE